MELSLLSPCDDAGLLDESEAVSAGAAGNLDGKLSCAVEAGVSLLRGARGVLTMLAPAGGGAGLAGLGVTFGGSGAAFSGWTAPMAKPGHNLRSGDSPNCGLGPLPPGDHSNNINCPRSFCRRWLAVAGVSDLLNSLVAAGSISWSPATFHTTSPLVVRLALSSLASTLALESTSSAAVELAHDEVLVRLPTAFFPWYPTRRIDRVETFSSKPGTCLCATGSERGGGHEAPLPFRGISSTVKHRAGARAARPFGVK
mmetsp:Transcript_11426/g.25912  ORF Transcript_11426/g.25912 Transcript_11426/m.25912 type:complete len:256 (-) Transcript_11426:320-1087(-)